MQCSHRCPGWMFSLDTFGWLSQTVRIVGELASSQMNGKFLAPGETFRLLSLRSVYYTIFQFGKAMKSSVSLQLISYISKINVNCIKHSSIKPFKISYNRFTIVIVLLCVFFQIKCGKEIYNFIANQHPIWWGPYFKMVTSIRVPHLVAHLYLSWSALVVITLDHILYHIIKYVSELKELYVHFCNL